MRDTNPHPESREAIAQRLRLMRRALGLTQTEICRKLDITPSMWSYYEKGTRRISIEEAMKVARKTHTTLDWIYRGIDAYLPKNIADNLPAALAEDERERELAKGRVETRGRKKAS